MKRFVIAGIILLAILTPVTTVGKDAQSFLAHCYTLRDIVVFSYFDDTNVEIWNQDQTELLWSGTLNQDEFHHQFASGLYHVQADKEFSVLIGDPLSELVQGWTAVNQYNRPLSTKLLTVVQGSWVGGHTGVEKFNVFAYHPNTHFNIWNLDDGSSIWGGDLDSLEYWDFYNDIGNVIGSNVAGVPVLIEASKEVSAISYGDCGYYLPAFNGTFTGRDFIGYLGDMGGWNQSLKIIPWEEDVNVAVIDLNEPMDTLWDVHVPEKGDIQEHDGLLGRYVKIQADKDISCAFLPGQSNYNHLTRAIDRNGLGIGTEFLVPTLPDAEYAPGQLDIVSFCDDNEVEVRTIPEDSSVWSGILNHGEYHRIMTIAPAHSISSTRPVSVIESAGGQAGVDFIPVVNAAAIAVKEEPVISENLTNCTIVRDILYVSNPDGGEIALSFYDASGRKLLSETATGKEVKIDLSRLANGVYFVSFERSAGVKETRKIIIQ